MIDHNMTPPPELVGGWILESDIPGEDMYEGIATRAAQWGADQELEAVCQLLFSYPSPIYTLSDIRAARRPRPPSLKEQALEQLQVLNQHGVLDCNTDKIRRALEALPE
jgi:hypothetical protein